MNGTHIWNSLNLSTFVAKQLLQGYLKEMIFQKDTKQARLLLCTNLMLPANLTTGTTLNDYSITMGIAGINTTSRFTGVKVVAEETIEVSGHSIPCVVVESTASVKVLGMNRSSVQKTWYGRGIGVVKLETYDNKGKLDTTQTLTSIEGL